MKSIIGCILICIVALPFLDNLSFAKGNRFEAIQANAENQIRKLIEPLLDLYCNEACKLLSVSVAVDLKATETLEPGFDEQVKSVSEEPSPSLGNVKILIDEKMGSSLRGKIIELAQQYLETLPFPVKIDTQTRNFPLTKGSDQRVSQIRNQIAKQFQDSINELLSQFCPQHCLLGNFDLQTEVVTGEDVQYGNPGEFFHNGDITLRVKDLSATLLMDDALSPNEQANILEMAKLKTGFLYHVTLAGKTLKFPLSFWNGMGRGPGFLNGNGQNGFGYGYDNKNNTTDNKAESNTNSNTSNNTASNDQKSNAESKSLNEMNSKSNSNSNSKSSDNRDERSQRIEKIERVESGDAVQAELQKFKVVGIIFFCILLSLLVFSTMATLRSTKPAPMGMGGGWGTVLAGGGGLTLPGHHDSARGASGAGTIQSSSELAAAFSKRFEADRLYQELLSIYSQYPKVAKYVFGKVLTEEGIEFTAACIHLFGETIVLEILKDPSLQTDLTELLDYYSKNDGDIEEDDKLTLLRKLHNRTVVGKLTVLGSRSTHYFDFLTEMDSTQITELIRTESLTVKSIVLTQCEPAKRAAIFMQMDNDARMKLLSELTRIDYLPKEFIYNVSQALKQKRKSNPKLNTEALPGSEVLVGLLEKSSQAMQQTVIKNLEFNNPESARLVKGKLVSLETLKYLRDGQLLEVVLSVRYDELVQFLKGVPEDIRVTILAKSPRDLVAELEEELSKMTTLSRDAYFTIERKILNKIKTLANEGHINLHETNDRMFAETDKSKIASLKAG